MLRPASPGPMPEMPEFVAGPEVFEWASKTKLALLFNNCHDEFEDLPLPDMEYETVMDRAPVADEDDAGNWPELPPGDDDDDDDVWVDFSVAGSEQGKRRRRRSNSAAEQPSALVFRCPEIPAVKQLVLEVFSQPRVTKMAQEMGYSADLWDALKAGDRSSLLNFILATRPRLTILSPPCTMFSDLMRYPVFS